jgi:hypothetical protein
VPAGRGIYELPDAKPTFLAPALARLCKEHGFQLIFGPAAGLDAFYAEVERGPVRLEVAWDIWSGFCILSSSDAGYAVVAELAVDFDAHKDDAIYDEYFELK